MDTVDTISLHVISKILKLSIIHYLTLSLATCHIAQIHTEKVDFRFKFSLTFDGKGGLWEVLKRYPISLIIKRP